MPKYFVISSDTDSAFNQYSGEPEVYVDIAELSSAINEDIRENEVDSQSYEIYEIGGKFVYTPPTGTGTITPVVEK